MNYILLVKDHLNPQKVDQWIFPRAVSALNKELVSRIARAALFAFASSLTVAAVVLTEASPVIWPVAGPVVLVSLVAWFIFIKFSPLEKMHVEGLGADKRSELAKSEFKRLVFDEQIGRWSTEKALSHLNRILGGEIFSEEFGLRVEEIKYRSVYNKTLFQAANDWNISLEFEKSARAFQRGYYGEPHKEYQITVSWTGKKEDEPIFNMTEREIQPLQPIIPGPTFPERPTTSPASHADSSTRLNKNSLSHFEVEEILKGIPYHNVVKRFSELPK